MEKPVALCGDEGEEKAKLDLAKRATEKILKIFGFQLEHASPQLIDGRFVVNTNSAQAFGMLHGGASAFIAETLASYGAYLASGSERVAGIQLSINHLRAASMGTKVFASAKRIQMGKRIQVWDVSFFKVVEPGECVSEQNAEVNKLAVSRVTMRAGLTGQLLELSDQDMKIHARL